MQQTITSSDPLEIVVDPPSAETYQLKYEGLHHIEGPWCTISVYRRPGLTVIVATDECDTHQDCSITNRIERVMYLAWEKAGQPMPCAFVEHYEHKQSRRHGHEEHFDLVEFAADAAGWVKQACWAAGRNVGNQFAKPDWTPLRKGNPAPKNFLLPKHYERIAAR